MDEQYKSKDIHLLYQMYVKMYLLQKIDQNRLASLLPVGIESLEGDFKRGDVVRIINPSGNVLGCGRAQYDSDEASKIIGQQGHKPLIHYDYLYLNE